MSEKKLRIVIPGGSGQIGNLLARHFHGEGHEVCVLSRNPKPALWREAIWDGRTPGGWMQELEGSDVCINLAGRSVNCRYNQTNRQEIYNSRIDSTRVLNEAIASLAHPPSVWLNSSTATIYRHSLNKPMRESDGELGGHEPGALDTWNFSIRVAKDWEQAFFATPTPRTRKIAMRSAITMSAGKGGIFDVLSTLATRGLGGANGSGDQMVSWVHGEDFVRAVKFLIAEESFSGVVNIVSPNPLPNREFMQALREAWAVHVGLQAPAWLIEIGCFLMQTESELVLKSRYVVPDRLERAGFSFDFPEWRAAAANLARQSAQWTSRTQ